MGAKAEGFLGVVEVGRGEAREVGTGAVVWRTALGDLARAIGEDGRVDSNAGCEDGRSGEGGLSRVGDGFRSGVSGRPSWSTVSSDAGSISPSISATVSSISSVV